jgi:hypothetical protein
LAREGVDVAICARRPEPLQACREISQRAFIACVSSAPLPGVAWNVTEPPWPLLPCPICINQYRDPPAAASSRAPPALGRAGMCRGGRGARSRRAGRVSVVRRS